MLQALLSSDEPVPAAVGDAAELRHVHVDERTGVVVLVAADRFPGDSVNVRQTIDAAAHQDRVNGRRGQPQLAGDLRRTEPTAPPGLHDLLDDRQRRLARHRARPTRSILHPGSTLGAEPGRPFPGRDGRNHEHFRGHGRRPTVLDDQARQAQASTRRQDSLSVRHEDLQAREAVELNSSTSQPEVFAAQHPKAVSPKRDWFLSIGRGKSARSDLLRALFRWVEVWARWVVFDARSG